jgi:hypothetical protein
MGLAARPTPGAATWGFAEDMAIFGKNILNLEKFPARPITLSHDGILTNLFFRVKRGTL